MQVGPKPPAAINKELACWLQVEEILAEEAHQGRDVATLEVMIEVARLLTCGQVEALEVPTAQVGGPPLVVWPS